MPHLASAWWVILRSPKRLHLLAHAPCRCTEGYDQSLYPGNSKQYSLAAADLFCSIMPSKVGAQ